MSLTLKVDTSAFSAMIHEFSAALDHPPEEVLKEEVGKVLEKAADNTAAASAEKIRSRAQSARFSLQPGSLYTPKRRIRRHPRQGGKVVYNLSWRYPNALWSRMSAARLRDVKRKLKARGLAKQSWVLIADKLGIDIKVPGYVRAAVASTGKTYNEDTEVTQKMSGSSVFIHIENSQPTVNAIGGDEALQKAIDGRVDFFITNVKHGVFNHLNSIASKYPGVKITAISG